MLLIEMSLLYHVLYVKVRGNKTTMDWHTKSATLILKGQNMIKSRQQKPRTKSRSVG